jgi:hypothetical protein
MGGRYCDCGTPDCICDPGEMNVNNQAADDNLAAPSVGLSASGFDSSTGAMILLLALFVAVRMRL